MRSRIVITSLLINVSLFYAITCVTCEKQFFPAQNPDSDGIFLQGKDVANFQQTRLIIFKYIVYLKHYLTRTILLCTRHVEIVGSVAISTV